MRLGSDERSCRRKMFTVRLGQSRVTTARRRRASAMISVLLALALGTVTGASAVTGGLRVTSGSIRIDVLAHARSAPTDQARKRAPRAVQYPVGAPNANEPSGLAPPSPQALAGYRQSYVTNFSGASLPPGWSAFSGTPSGMPGGQFSLAHVAVSGDLLNLNAWRDPAFGDAWVTGGVCQCQVANTYGAYFVRSRMTGAGPTQVDLLWPSVGWPPEIDFNETYGGVNYSMATLHYTSQNLEIHQTVNVDMTKWHTWGVVWTPTSITYTLDGRAWATIQNPSIIPDVPMTLHIQQQASCAGAFACPTIAAATQVNWVAEYVPLARVQVVVGPFAPTGAKLSTSLRSEIAAIANIVVVRGAKSVSLTSFDSATAGRPPGRRAGAQRVRAVVRYLRQLLESRHVAVPKIITSVSGGAHAPPPSSTGSIALSSRQVIAVIS